MTEEPPQAYTIAPPLTTPAAPTPTVTASPISPSDILVSRFHPVRKKGDKVVIADAAPLSVIANEIRSDPQLQAQTLSVRPLKATDKAAYNRTKKRLSCMVPAADAGSGVLWAKLAIEHHNGLYGFDIDKGVTDAPALLELIKQTPGAVMAGVSLGGADLWCIFAGPQAKSLDEYKSLWLAISHQFPENLRATSGDESNHFNRARTFAHDPNVWLAESVIPLELEAVPTGKGKGQAKAQNVKGLLDLLDVPQGRTDWLNLLHLLKAAGLEMADVEKWSSRGEKYRDGEVEEAWDSLEPEETKQEALAKLERIATKNTAKPGTYILGDRTMLDDLAVVRRAMADRGREVDDGTAPRLFTTNGYVCRMALTETLQLDHLALMDELAVDAVWKHLEVTGDGKMKLVSAVPSMDALRTAVSASSDRAGLPELNTIVHQPLVLSYDGDYKVVEKPGYIAQAGVLSRVPDGLQGMDVETARATLNDAFGLFETGANRPVERTGFRFTDEQAAANAAACLFTPMLRHADRWIIPPMFAVTKVERETGATTFLQAVALLTTGKKMQGITWGKDAVELEKAIGALFIQGTPIIFFDNVVAPTESSLLSTLISEGDSSTRQLGKSKLIGNLGPVTLMMSANTTSIGEDYANRICQIDLDWGAAKSKGDDLSNAFRHNPYLPWLEEHKVIVLSALCAVLRAALLRLPSMEAGKSRFPVWERWANAILAVLELPPVKVGILTENLETPEAVKGDLLNGLVQKALKSQQVDTLKRDAVVYAFDGEGYDPSKLPGVRGLEEPPGGFGAGLPGGLAIAWDQKDGGAQQFGTWLNQLVRSKYAVWWNSERWSLRASVGKGVRREHWISAEKE